MNKVETNKRFPRHGYAGIVLIIVFWALNWSLAGVRTHLLFFPLWLGYSLTVDAIVYTRKGTSLFSRSRSFYILLFILSIPVWWIFEAYNTITHNWIYDGKEHFSDFYYALYASINFSVVIPAVFGTAELVRSFGWVDRLTSGPKIKPDTKTAVIMFLSGIAMLVLLALYPRYFFPFIWGSAYLIVEPLNMWLGNNNLILYTFKRDWRPVVSLMLGCLITGFFWEMWNYYSYPKWVYNVPFVDFLHIFEMPLVGFIGYLPFSLELYAFYNFFTGFINRKKLQEYIKL